MLMEYNEIEEELFCLRFELESLSEVLLRNESERWMPGFSNSFVEKDHYLRYNWVIDYVEGKNVLDIACGAGKGSFILAEKGNANFVLGCDINEKSIRYAKHRNKHPKVQFSNQNATELNFNEDFDVVVSFETIEHLNDVDKFLKNIYSALKPGGIFIVSTPISRKNIDKSPKNPYHFCEWGFEQFHKVISKYFIVESIYLQLYPKKIIYSSNLILRVFQKFLLKKNPYIKNESELIKYNYDIPVYKLGNERTGFQILLCKKS